MKQEATQAGVLRALPFQDPTSARSRSDRAPRLGTPRAFFIALLLPTMLLNLIGLGYYLQPLGGRLRDPLHVWLKPSGVIGQAAGVVALALFVFLWLYPLRKRLPVLRSAGLLSRWLDLHIVAGLMLPVVAGTHAAWRFNGLIAVGYLAMAIVCLSGVAGRYLYRRIPRSATGQRLSAEQVDQRRAQLLDEITRLTGFDRARLESALGEFEAASGEGGIVRRLVAGDIAAWRAGRRLRGQLRATAGTAGLDRRTVRRVVRLARSHVDFTRQMRVLAATRQLFRYWHIGHLPFAVTAFIAVLIHVVVAVRLGVTWFW